MNDVFRPQIWKATVYSHNQSGMNCRKCLMGRPITSHNRLAWFFYSSKRQQNLLR
jgi:hypothetical protein